MKKILSMLFVVFMAVFGATFTIQAEDLTIVGTGNGMAILQVVGEAFTRMHPEITVIVPESIDSGGGIKAVGKDENVLGRVARKIKEKEEHYGLTYVPFAKIPTVFFVNTSVTIQKLSIQQVLDIYSGTITNWKDVGGNDAKIRVITREEGSSALKILKQTFPGFTDITVTDKSKITVSQAETVEAVERIKGSIAYGSLGNAQNADVTVIAIGDKTGSDSDYPYVGELALIYKEENYTGSVKKFVEFATSEAAHEAIKNAGGIPF